MKQKLLSIIIPVYNVEKYISRCLDSIYNQGIDEDVFEVVVVNDGSSDNSSVVVKGYQNNHRNILYFEKENGGVSSARNKAIIESKGEYLVFVDPDDALIDGALCLLSNYIECHHKESIIVLRSFKNNNIECYKWEKVFSNHSHHYSLHIINKGYARGSVCGCVFLKEFVIKNNILFPEGIKNSEDTIFFFHCMALTNELVFEDIKFYHIIGRDDSASKVYSKDRIDSAIKSLKYLEDLLQYFSKDKEVMPILNFLKYILISNLVYASSKTKGCGYLYLKQMSKHRDFYKVDTTRLDYKAFNMKLLNLSFCLYYMLNKIYFL